MSDENKPPVPNHQALLWLGVLLVGYIGVYLCRKNLAVVIPMLQQEFGATRADVGKIASYSTIAYAVGKFLFGPVVDKIGGRTGFLASLCCVAVFGMAGAFSPSLGMLALLYSANRLCGSAAWPGMVKLVPEWFAERRMALAMALLSLSFVFGGICATLLAGQIAEWSGNNWRIVMGGPSLVLIALLALSWAVLPKGPVRAPNAKESKAGSAFQLNRIGQLLRIRKFWIVCALSFTLTLLRETFNTWTVDFMKSEGGAEMSNRIAAFLSTPFDAFGAVGIVTLGWLFGRIGQATRSWTLFAMLVSLAVLLYSLPGLSRHGLWAVTTAVGGIGFFAYGPYSLLAGVFSVEIRGKEWVGTVSGIVDGVGYIAGILAGQQFGRIVDLGGYRLGFRALAVLALASAILCLFLYPSSKQTRKTPYEYES